MCKHRGVNMALATRMTIKEFEKKIENEPMFLTAEETARIYGVSVQQMRIYLKNELIPAVRFGSSWRVPTRAVMQDVYLTCEKDEEPMLG